MCLFCLFFGLIVCFCFCFVCFSEFNKQGRLLDHLNQNPQLMSNLCFLVLDEADRLLDEGFQRDMEAIFKLLPTKRRTILASATLPANLNQYKHLCLREDHVSVSAIEPGSEATNAQLVEKVKQKTKNNFFFPFPFYFILLCLF
jgi:superfamily II DNA/RNA helicase